MQALASAVSTGALAQCTHLNLFPNQIGDAGMSALASPCANGALASLRELSVDDESTQALKAACEGRAARGIESGRIDRIPRL